MMYTDELRRLAEAAFELGYRTRFTAFDVPSARDRLEAKYGPMDTAWRWFGPWRRYESDGLEYHPLSGWEREYEVPGVDVETGEHYWYSKGSKWGMICLIHIFDAPLPDWHAQALDFSTPTV